MLCGIFLNERRCFSPMIVNELFVTILPIIQLGGEFGRTEQVLTLFPRKDLATKFFPDEVAGYLATLKNRLTYLTGGHVQGYDIHEDRTADGFVVLRVVQRVG
jgi:hypothetical protein